MSDDVLNLHLFAWMLFVFLFFDNVHRRALTDILWSLCSSALVVLFSLVVCVRTSSKRKTATTLPVRTIILPWEGIAGPDCSRNSPLSRVIANFRRLALKKLKLLDVSPTARKGQPIFSLMNFFFFIASRLWLY